MKVDAFCHILPKRYKEELYKKAPPNSIHRNMRMRRNLLSTSTLDSE